jgi:hypothetical protein
MLDRFERYLVVPELNASYYEWVSILTSISKWTGWD